VSGDAGPGRAPAAAAARRRPLATLVLAGWALAGCAALGGRLEVPPGHRVVLGAVDLTRFEQTEALLDIVRADRTFREAVRVSPTQRRFVVTLPPGAYRIARIVVLDSGAATPNRIAYDLPVTFEVGDAPTVYVGTLRVIRDFDSRVRVEVLDEYDRTVPALRAQHPEIRDPVARALMRPA
jgi:hypothetical protein